MIYRTRKGVILTEVCDQYLLVSAEMIREYCPYVTQLNETSAFLWRQLEQGASMEQLQAAVAAEYEVDDPGTVREAIQAFLQQMCEMNYLLAEETEDPE